MTSERWLSLPLAASVAAAILSAQAPDARADGVRAHVRIGVRGYVGLQFAAPPPPPPPRCASPCEPPGRVGVRPAPPPPPAAPRWGLGLAAGHTVQDDGRDGDELAVLARLRASSALELELELARTEFDAGDRFDRRSAVAVYWMLLPHATLVPYAVGALGAGQAEMLDGKAITNYGYGELGGGLQWRLSERLSVAANLRVGGRAHDVEDACPFANCAATPLPMEREEPYTRGRFVGMLYF